jgi:hypothetical protein
MSRNTNKTVNITKFEKNGNDKDGNPIFNNKNHTISINEFITTLNSIPSSKNSIEICNAIGLTDIYCKNYALQYSITYKEIFKGKNINDNSLKLLKTIGFDDKIIINNKLYKNIMYIKIKIDEFKQKQQFDNVTAEWIGILSGIMLYFDEIDEQNYNQTLFLRDVCKPFTINNF